ncbi:MAG TPA: glycosyltransferase [Candidatus Dormibacteraeota bacterium]|nr:glycosyltransferase [Candidatus Dormibacteraeota bacterium]
MTQAAPARTLAVAWADHQPRTSALAAALDGEAAFVTSRLPRGPATAPLRYLSAALRTWRLLERRRPSRVVVVIPPVVAPLVAGLWCWARRRPLVADCHTGAFHSRRWAWARPLYRRLLPRCRVVLVHTDEALALVRAWGGPGLLLPDDLPDPDGAGPPRPEATSTVLVAGSLDENEPVADTLAAAALAPEVEFRITGDPGRLAPALQRSAPPNVVFTGFLPHPAFLAEMREAGAVAVFSIDPHIMNRAAFEAVGLGRPLVLSDLGGLRRRFGAAALFAPDRPEAMADAVRQALAGRRALTARSRDLAVELRRQRATAMGRLRAMLADRPGTRPRARVLRITQHPFPADSIVRRDVLELTARDLDVDVVCSVQPAGDEPVDAGGGMLHVHRIPIRHRRGGLIRYALEYTAFFLAALALVSWLGLRRRYVAVQVDNLPDLLVFAAVVPRLRGARLVLTLYELAPEMVAARFRGRLGRVLVPAARLMEVAATRWADHVIVVSQPCLHVLLRRGVPRARTSVVLNTTPWGAEHPPPAPGRARSLTLVTHTTLVERYGVHVAIEALALLGPSWPGLTLRVVGDGEQRQALVRLARSAGVDDRVVFTGALPWSKTLAEVSRARLGIVPVLADGYGQLLLPTKLLEYARLGVPAVCSRLPAIEAYFPPDAVAYARPGDPRDLAEGIDALLRQPAAAEARARRASEIARRLAWDHVRGDYLAALGLPAAGPPAPVGAAGGAGRATSCGH